MTYMGSKCANLCHWLNMCKNVPETVQWIKKVQILWKNGLNFKLKHRNAQKSILSRRFGALTGRSGDLMKNLETPGKTGRVGRYAFLSHAQPDLNFCRAKPSYWKQRLHSCFLYSLPLESYKKHTACFNTLGEKMQVHVLYNYQQKTQIVRKSRPQTCLKSARLCCESYYNSRPISCSHELATDFSQIQTPKKAVGFVSKLDIDKWPTYSKENT